MIDESDSHLAKHSDSRISTLLGIKIDSSDELQNASDSICVKREFDSNVIDESEIQLKKHPHPRMSTFFGIKIDSIREK
jgi:hypothetical protein